MDQEERAKSLDAEISRITKSTRTTVPAILSLHDILRQKYSWYYQWHLNPYASKVHAAILSLILITGLAIGSLSIFSLPHFSKAATTNCTWTNAAGTNSWSTAGNWSCGAVPDNTYNVILDGAVSSSTMTIDVAATAASFTINTGYTQTVTANYNLTLDTSQGGTGSFQILAAATYTANATTITVPGNWDSAAGTFTYNTSTVKMTGTTKTIKTSSTLESWEIALYRLTVDTGASVSLETVNTGNGTAVSNLITVSGTLTIPSGETLTIQNGGTLTVGGSGHLTGAGTFSKNISDSTTALTNSGTIDVATFNQFILTGTTTGVISATTFGGNLNIHGQSGTVTGILQAGTLNVTGDISIYSNNSAGITTVDNTSNNTAITCANINIGTSYNSSRYAVLKPGTGTTTINGNANIYASDASGVNKIDSTSVATPISVAGNWANSDTFTAGTSTVTFTKATGTQTLNSGGTGTGFLFNNLTHSGAGTLQLTSNLDVNGTLTNSSGPLDFNSLNIFASSAVTMTGSTVTGTSNSTLTFDGTLGQTFTTAGLAYNNITLNDTGTAGANERITVTGNLDINGALTITDGSLYLVTSNPNVNTAGAVTIAAAGLVNKGTGTWTFDGTTTYTDSEATKSNIGPTVVNGTSTTLASSMTVDTMTVTSGTLNLGSSGYILKLSNVGALATPLSVSGTLNPGSNSTVQYATSNSGGNINIATVPYNNLRITNSETFDMTGSLTGANAMTGSLTLDNSAFLILNTYVGTTSYDISCVNVTINTSSTLFAGTANSTGTSTLTVSGNWVASGGTFTGGKSTVVMNGSSAQMSVKSNDTYYNVRFSNNITLVTANQLYVQYGTVTIDNGYTLTVNSSQNLNIATSLVLNGDINGAGTLKIGAANVISGSGNINITSTQFVGTVGFTIPSRTYGGNVTAIFTHNGAAQTVTFSAGTLNVSGYLYLQAGGTYSITFDFNTNNPTVNITGDFKTNGAGAGSELPNFGSSTITVGGNYDFTGGTVTAGTSTVDFTKSSGTQTLNSGGTAAANTFNNVTHSGAGTLQLLTNNINIDGTFTNSAGTFDTNSLDMTVAGNFANTATFTQGTRTVTLDGAGGTTQVISGSTTFYNLTAQAAAARTIQFASGSTTAVTNLDFDGSAGQLLTLNSSTPGTHYHTNVTNAPTLTYIDAKDSDASGGALITANTSNDSGNNTNWSFGGGVTYISGTVYTNENKSTNVGAGISVAMSVNGGAKNTTTTIAGGIFSFNSVGVAANNTLTIFTDDVTHKSNLVTQVLNTTNDITGLEMYTGDIAIRHETAGPMTNTLLDTADNLADANMFFSVTTGNATFTKKLWVESGFTYTPGGQVIDTSDLEVRGTATFAPAANAVSVTGNWTMSATGTFTTSGTVTFDKASSTQTLVSGGKAFSGVTHSGAGTLQLVTNDLDVNGIFNQTSGTFDANSKNQNYAGAFSLSNGTTYTKGGTLTFDGTSTITDSNTTKQDLGTITVLATSATLASSIKVSTMSVVVGTLNLGSSGYTLELAGTGSTATVFNNYATITPGTSTVKYTATNSGGNVNVTTVPYSSLQFTPASAESYDMTGSLTTTNAMTGSLTIDANATLTTTALNYNLDCVNLTINTGGTLTANASTFTVSGNWDHSAGTFTYGTSTVNLTGTGNLKTPGSNQTVYFYNLSVAAATKTTTLQSHFGTSNSTTLGTGNLTGAYNMSFLGTGTQLVNAGATISITNIVFKPSSGTVTVPAGNYGTLTGSLELYSVHSGITFQFGGDITVTGNTWFVAVGGGSSGTVNTQDHVLTTTGIIFGDSGATLPITANFGNSTVNVGANGITMASNGGSHTFNLNSSTINDAGNWSMTNGTGAITLVASTSTVNFTKSSGTQTLNSGGSTNPFNNLTHSGLGILQATGTNLKVSGNFTNTGSSFDLNNLGLNVAGNCNLGPFNDGASPIVGVVLDGAAAQTFTMGGTGAGYTPKYITITNASSQGVTFADSLTMAAGGILADNTANSKLTFNAGSTYTIPTLDLDGTAGNLITLRSSTDGTHYHTNVTNAPTLTYIDAKDSDASGGALITANTSNDSGNNTNWTFGSGVTYMSGTVYTNENKSTNVGAGITVALSVNGGAKNTTTTIAGGVFSFNSVGVAANNTLTFFTDDVTNKSNLVTQVLNITNDITGLEMYTGDIALRHETAGPMTNTLLDTADNLGDANMFFSVTTGNATFTKKLWIESGFTYTPGGQVIDTSDLEVRGTATFAPAANAVSVTGNWTMSATGTFTTSGTVTFDKASSTQTLVSGSKAFSSLTHSGAGTLQLVTNDLDVNGIFTNSAGTFDANSINMTFAGAWNNTGTATFTRSAGTMTFDGTSTVTNSSSNAASLAAVAISGTATLGSDLTMTSNSGAGTLNLGAGSYTLTLTGTGTPLAVTTFDKGTGSTVNYIGYTTATTVAAVAYNNLLINPAFSATTTYSLAGALSGGTAMTGDLTIYSGATLTTTGSNYNIDCVNFTNNGVLTANGSTLSVSGNWTNSDTFTAGTSTVIFSSTSPSTITGTTTFNNLTMDAGVAKTINFPTGLANKTTVNGTWNINNSAAAEGARLTLASVTPSTAWEFVIPASFTSGNYITVSDSQNNTNAFRITPGANCTDGGNNDPGWIFNTAPTNDSLTFTNPYSTNVAVADDTTSWQFQAKVSDVDGPTNINYVEMRFANSADSTTPYDSLKFRWTETTDTFSETADTQTAATITSTGADSSSSVNQWTLNFKIKFNNSFLAKDTEYAVELYTVDDAAGSDLDNYATLYQVTPTSISLGVDSGTIAFGSLTPGSPVTASNIFTVTTNYPAGYTLLAQDDVTGSNSALLHTDTTTYIVDNAGTITTPATWVTNPLGLGICVFQATNKEAKWGTGTTETDSNNQYAGVPETSATIHSKTGSPTSGDQTYIGYKLDVLNSQKSGNYAGTVTYTATGVLN